MTAGAFLGANVAAPLIELDHDLIARDGRECSSGK